MRLQNQNPQGIALKVSKFILAVFLAAPALSMAQMTIYTDSLVNGWEDWGYATENYANTSPVHSGSDSISVTISSGYQGIQIIHSTDLTNTSYASISFWLNGGASGGQHLQMYGTLDTGGAYNAAQNARYYLSTPAASTWQQYTVPLSSLGVANTTNFTGFVIQDSANSAEPTFYLDDIQLNPVVPPPTTVHVTVNAGQSIRTADTRFFGINATIWDNNFDMPQTLTILTNMGVKAIRFPGGSDSDDYHWVYNRQDANDWSWTTSPASFIHVITNINGTAMTTLNYGTGSTNEAAAWVAYVNATTSNMQSLGVDAAGTNWHTAAYWAALRSAVPLGTDDGKNFLRISRSAPLGFKYWEIGNEEYGSWETDSNSVPHDPYTYALRARDYISLIKAVDPTVKIGVVVTPGEDSYVNNTSHPAYNAREGTYHNGWTAVLLATLKSLGVTPDFAIYHNYPQNPGSESDAGLLDPTNAWALAASDLRQQITDYVGTSGMNIELVCTENNSVSSQPGKQSTSLVNGLYKADSLAQLMQTEFNGLFWWALRNGQETDGNMSSSLYGWRTYGDYGIVDSGYSNLYPTYYTAKLMQHFVQTGDTVITATNDYSMLSTYAVRRLDGSLTILAINKDPANTFTGQVKVASFTPATGVTVYSYGIPQDTAAQTSIGSPDVAQTNFSVAGTNFSYVFPPYSATVLELSPAPAKLLSIPLPPAANQFAFQLQGQAGVPYVIQRSTNLITWTSISTNTPLASTLNITNSITPSMPVQFWRAIWLP